MSNIYKEKNDGLSIGPGKYLISVKIGVAKEHLLHVKDASLRYC